MSDNTKIDWLPPMPDDQMAAAYQSVQAKLTRTAGGEVRNTLQNFVTALTHDPVLPETSAEICSRNACR